MFVRFDHRLADHVARNPVEGFRVVTSLRDLPDLVLGLRLTSNGKRGPERSTPRRGYHRGLGRRSPGSCKRRMLD